LHRGERRDGKTVSCAKHVLLWWLSDDAALKPEAREAISDPSSIIYVSAASAWEISIKKALGKLDAPDDLHMALVANHFQPLADYNYARHQRGTIATSS